MQLLRKRTNRLIRAGTHRSLHHSIARLPLTNPLQQQRSTHLKAGQVTVVILEGEAQRRKARDARRPAAACPWRGAWPASCAAQPLRLAQVGQVLLVLLLVLL